MNLSILPGRFTVCKISDISQVDFTAPFCFVGKTDEELSLVCDTGRTPTRTIAREDGWRAFRVQGPLDFGLVGVLADITAILASKGISLFAVSTYNTDYLLTKAEFFDSAIQLLKEHGCVII